MHRSERDILYILGKDSISVMPNGKYSTKLVKVISIYQIVQKQLVKNSTLFINIKYFSEKKKKKKNSAP